MWDNVSTGTFRIWMAIDGIWQASRGLDASTALSFVEVMRVMSDVLGNTNIISLYAGPSPVCLK